jgi:hypothetical protein
MPRNKRSGGYRVRFALAFLMHQIIGTEGVVWLTALVFGCISSKENNRGFARTMGEFRTNAMDALDIDQYTFLSGSNCCGRIPRMETLQTLGTSFDALGLDFALRRACLRCYCNPDL